MTEPSRFATLHSISSEKYTMYFERTKSAQKRDRTTIMQTQGRFLRKWKGFDPRTIWQTNSFHDVGYRINVLETDPVRIHINAGIKRPAFPPLDFFRIDFSTSDRRTNKGALHCRKSRPIEGIFLDFGGSGRGWRLKGWLFRSRPSVFAKSRWALICGNFGSIVSMARCRRKGNSQIDGTGTFLCALSTGSSLYLCDERRVDFFLF